MKQWIEIAHTKKRTGRIIIWKYTGKKIVDHFKLKLWAFFWGQGECEWPLYCCYYKIKITIVHALPYLGNNIVYLVFLREGDIGLSLDGEAAFSSSWRPLSKKRKNSWESCWLDV